VADRVDLAAVQLVTKSVALVAERHRAGVGDVGGESEISNPGGNLMRSSAGSAATAAE